MTKLIKNKKYAYIISIFCMFLWGSAFPTIKLTYQELNIGPSDYFAMVLVAGIRFFTAGLIVLFIMYLFDRKSISQLKSKFPYLFKLGFLVITLGYFFFYIGTGNTSGMKSALLTSSSTFLVVIMSHFLLKNESFNKYKFIAIILGLTGVVLSNIDKSFDFSFLLIGEGFMLINSLLGAYGTIYVKKKSKNVSPFASAAGQFLYGGFMLMVLGIILNTNTLIFTPKAILLILYGGIISSVAFSLWYLILSHYKASEVTFLRLFIPFFGTFLSAIILGESLSLGILVGLTFVILGIIVINKSKQVE